jgi:exopolysaccharide biosynthesis polyprenyl glycosylphosphotransferase
MTGRRQELNLQLNQIIDGFLLVAAFWSAHALRYWATLWFSLDTPIAKFDEFRWLLFIIMPFGPILLELQGYYVHPSQKTLLRSLNQMLQAGFWLALFIGSCVIFFRVEVPSRAVALIFMGLAGSFLGLREWTSMIRFRARARSGRDREPVLLAGSAPDLRALRSSLTEVQLIEMEIVGEIDIERQPVSALIEALHKFSVSRVIFAGSHSNLGRLQQAIGACEIEGVEAWLVADFIKTSIAKPDFDVMGTRPMLVFRTTPEVSWALMIKSVIDRLGALAIVVLSAPMFIFAALGIKLTSPGPIIFRQQRSGKNGRPFTMYKFRSMDNGAEQRQTELQQHNEMSGPVFKVENDPRVTAFGHWLRKTSIDELPQLINVLQGHMSLVGPRPLPLYEVAKFENSAQRRRLSVKPGLTCLWQISGRSDVTDFQDWVRLDLAYIDNWSIWLDLQILVKTVPAVLLGFGAR